MSTAYHWDAQGYARHSSEQQRWGRELIVKLGLKGTERVLDIGCGDGKVTAEIAARLPLGSVLGIDNSPDMIALAQQTFPGEKHPNLAFRREDARSLSFQAEFDVVFSSAALHWVLDHRPVLEGIRQSLKPGGRILLQMGGKGNAAELLAVFERLMKAERWAAHFQGFSFPYGFFVPDQYNGWLRRAGLTPRRAVLIPKKMVHRTREEFAAWIRTTWLPYTERVPENERAEFIEEAATTFLRARRWDGKSEIALQMVRLEVEASKC